MEADRIRLTILLPSRIFLDREVRQLTAGGPVGEFCLKPRHIDYVTALVPGILMYVGLEGEERFIAVDGGILVKEGDRVEVAVRNAAAGELGELRQVVEKMHDEYAEREKVSRTASARLEIGFLKQFLQLSGG